MITLSALSLMAALAQAAPCESLRSVTLSNTTVTSAELVAAGPYTAPAAGGPPGGPVVAPAGGGRGDGAGRGGGRGAGAAPAGRGGGRGGAPAAAPGPMLPAHCRVAATLRPSSDSVIDIEVWMPVADRWNGKFQAVGNGGWAGTIAYPAMAAALAQGYATASTDTGHVGNSADFALGHPEKLVDFSHRAIHETAVKAKAIIQASYGTAPRLSYFSGCSQGGRQGITAAQRYPADFDGIIAGAPATGGLRMHAARMALNHTVNKSPDRIIPAAKYPVIHEAVLNACDARDGVKDGVIENPTMCRFDPQVLACRGEDTTSCLTPGQVESARAMVSPMKHPRTGQVYFEGHLWPGAELGWATLGGPEPNNNVGTALKNLVFKDPKWDAHSFDPETDLDRALKVEEAPLLVAGDGNLKPFFDRGGKLLLYHGWADPQVTPQTAIMYHNTVMKAVGSSASDSMALFMVPGMGHCNGGPGTDTFDKMAVMEQWIERRQKPTRIVASHLTNGKVDKTRPLCPFGQVAKWNGTGSTNDAASFACVAEPMDTAVR